ncbi:HD-GYP domain-containing protein [Sediminispirochaeta bajacaliforniensis]|uniref:HD-GYP domain-containing protein n=1 Tax=Sediminispirochaeta bajacaliforniensis TaxID=148 RepID=UPI00036203DF|nr:HD domain-containing phosphohydrolase [Sediminispirochaeta bajacaliforniensis]
MKSISTSSLEPQIYINAPLFLDEGYVLLTPDIPVTRRLIERLESWYFETVYSDGMPVDAPPADGTGKVGVLDATMKESEALQNAVDFITEETGKLAKVYTSFLEHNVLSINELSDIVKEIIAKLKEESRYLLALPDSEEEDQNFIVTHSVKTAVVALALSLFLNIPPHKQIEIGLAALLHEIGMIRIPPQIYKHNRKLTPKERQTIITHPVISFKILKEAGFPNPVVLAVLEHHEYIDGTGYPRKLRGDQISLYGKIIGVASSYAAAVSKRPFREGRDGHSGIMDLVKEMGRRYDDTILRALVLTLSVYPVGTYVLLTNKVKALVVKTDQKRPKEPTVRLLVNENNTLYPEQPVVQIREDNEVKIARPLSRSEIEELKKQLPLRH